MKSIISGIFILLSLNIFAGDICFNLAYETRGLVGAAELCRGVGSDACFNVAYETRGLVGAAEICQGVGIAISKR